MRHVERLSERSREECTEKKAGPGAHRHEDVSCSPVLDWLAHFFSRHVSRVPSMPGL